MLHVFISNDTLQVLCLWLCLGLEYERFTFIYYYLSLSRNILYYDKRNVLVTVRVTERNNA